MKTAGDALSQRACPHVSEWWSLLDLPLDHGPAVARSARHALRRALIGQGLAQDTIDDAVLVVSELIANAVTHAVPPITLHVRLVPAASLLVVSVADGGAHHIGPTGTTAAREHGRGRQVIAALATATGSTSEGHGSGRVHHWAALDLP